MSTTPSISPLSHTFPSLFSLFLCLLLSFLLEPTRLQLLHQECGVTQAQKGLPSAETVHKLKDGEVRISTLREETQDKLQQGLAGRGEGGRYRHTWESKTLEQTHTQYFPILVSNKTVVKTDTQFLILYKSWDPLPLLLATQDGMDVTELSRDTQVTADTTHTVNILMLTLFTDHHRGRRKDF